MKPTYRLSRWQLFLMAYITSFCITPFGFSTLMAAIGRHIWLANLAQFFVTLTGALGVTLLLRRFSGLPLEAIAIQSLGPFGGRLYLLALGLYLIFWGPIGNQFTILPLIQAVDLPLTNPYLIVGVSVLSAAFAAHFGPEVIARALEVWALPVLTSLLFLAIYPFLHGSPTQLLPLTVKPAFLFHPEFWSFALGLRGFILLLALAGMGPRGQDMALPVIGASLLSSLIITLIMLMPYTIYHADTLSHLQFPVIEAMDTLTANMLGIQSFMHVTMPLWYIISWAVVASTLFAGGQTFATGLGITSHVWPMVLLMGLSIIMAGYPIPMSLHMSLLNSWSALGYLVGVLGPWLLLILAYMRGVPKKERML